jgi:FixJ family two-component response regulator
MEYGKWLPLIVIGVGGDVQMAVSVMKQGAFYFIESPLETETLMELPLRRQ